jgi:uncharacterized protein YjbJ (UPF0337 family)
VALDDGVEIVDTEGNEETEDDELGVLDCVGPDVTVVVGEPDPLRVGVTELDEEIVADPLVDADGVTDPDRLDVTVTEIDGLKEDVGELVDDTLTLPLGVIDKVGTAVTDDVGEPDPLRVGVTEVDEEIVADPLVDADGVTDPDRLDVTVTEIDGLEEEVGELVDDTLTLPLGVIDKVGTAVTDDVGEPDPLRVGVTEVDEEIVADPLVDADGVTDPDRLDVTVTEIDGLKEDVGELVDDTLTLPLGVIDKVGTAVTDDVGEPDPLRVGVTELDEEIVADPLVDADGVTDPDRLDVTVTEIDGLEEDVGELVDDTLTLPLGVIDKVGTAVTDDVGEPDPLRVGVTEVDEEIVADPLVDADGVTDPDRLDVTVTEIDGLEEEVGELVDDTLTLPLGVIDKVGTAVTDDVGEPDPLRVGVTEVDEEIVADPLVDADGVTDPDRLDVTVTEIDGLEEEVGELVDDTLTLPLGVIDKVGTAVTDDVGEPDPLRVGVTEVDEEIVADPLVDADGVTDPDRLDVTVTEIDGLEEEVGELVDDTLTLPLGVIDKVGTAVTDDVGEPDPLRVGVTELDEEIVADPLVDADGVTDPDRLDVTVTEIDGLEEDVGELVDDTLTLPLGVIDKVGTAVTDDVGEPDPLRVGVTEVDEEIVADPLVDADGVTDPDRLDVTVTEIDGLEEDVGELVDDTLTLPLGVIDKVGTAVTDDVGETDPLRVGVTELDEEIVADPLVDADGVTDPDRLDVTVTEIDGLEEDVGELVDDTLTLPLGVIDKVVTAVTDDVGETDPLRVGVTELDEEIVADPLVDADGVTDPDRLDVTVTDDVGELEIDTVALLEEDETIEGVVVLLMEPVVDPDAVVVNVPIIEGDPVDETDIVVDIVFVGVIVALVVPEVEIEEVTVDEAERLEVPLLVRDIDDVGDDEEEAEEEIVCVLQACRKTIKIKRILFIILEISNESFNTPS